MERYLAAIDQSTTGTKAVIYDSALRQVARESLNHQQYYPRPGWVEQDAEEIFTQTCEVLRRAITASGAGADNIAALALSVQTGAFVVWDAHTGKPVHHIIGWQCNRGEEFCNSLSDAQREYILKSSGTGASAYLPAAKLAWMFANIDGLHERAERAEVLFGSIESFLAFRLSGGKVHATDYCNASITQLFNNEKLCWDDELLSIFGVPRAMLPEPRDADADFGTVAVDGLPALQITGVLGDSAAALFGQFGFTPGDFKITYGTGSSILLNLGDKFQPPAKGMTTSVGWRSNNKTVYVWEGTAVCTGAVVSWLVNDMEMLPDAAASESVAAGVADNAGVYLVPAFTGLGTPWSDPAARACIVGMSSGTGRAHVVRAALESIAYQIRDMVESMTARTGEPVPYILVDGGVTKNELLMQFQADILGVPVIRSSAEESSAFGAACVAALASGVCASADALKQLGPARKTFEPQMSRERADELYAGWLRAIEKACT